jgi:hypothetical protein
MQLDPAHVRRYLGSFDFAPLFTEELGWDHHRGTLPVEVEAETFSLEAIAQKRGMAAYVCRCTSIPPYRERRKIERKVARSVHEHLIIYTDGTQATQIWQWVKREPGKPAACREHRYDVGQPGDALIQKLQAIAFSLEEEEGLTILDVTRRVRAAFDVERVTRRFYDRFKAEQTAFLKFLEGVPGAEMKSWYVSVMINRLMFIYFIQKKGFLDDGDLNYLRHKLEESQQRGQDRFYSDLLCPLFFEGFARREQDRSPEARQILGRVPYLNGGLFLRHEIEHQHGERIRIPDAAFERLFTFFERYQWHLDDRPLRTDNEINPGVLGYIFEKYINQKQMGAYYTEEDITDYISKNTIIPFLFDRVRETYPTAFDGEDVVWDLLQEEPDRYIYPAVRHGAALGLPPAIAAGLDDVSQRGAWNTRTPEEYGLPTEIWRETVARRKRHEELWCKLVDGEVRDVNDLVTLNLDIRQFAQDVVGNCTDPAFLRAFWRAVNEVTVLDPTVGSGAFLFAALNVLEPLYEACLDRMAVFVEELKPGSRKLPDFREALGRVAQHPNQRYFVLKSIIVNNLFGVDIMDEAVEIAKLRLFLRLVAEVERVDEVEPLPDIDFNVRAGNTLVGFATYAEVERAVYQEGAQMKLLLGENPMVAIEQKAQDVDRLYQHFRQQQTELGGEVTPEDKQALRERLDALNDELDRYLAKEYGVDVGLPMDYHIWRESHKPFHWFVEFYGILKRGGFDVVVGNPPYVVYSKKRSPYAVRSYDSDRCRNLYAFTMERSLRLLHQEGRLGLIIPVSFVSAGAFVTLRDVVWAAQPALWLSHFANRPGQLFTGAQNRLTIVLFAPSKDASRVLSTRYHRWDAKRGERDALFPLLQYVPLGTLTRRFHGLFPKAGTTKAVSVLKRLDGIHTVEGHLVKSSEYRIYWVRVPGYFCQFLLEPPEARPEDGGLPRVRGEVNAIAMKNEKTRRVIHSILNSSTYYLFFCTYTDGRHINPSDVRGFPLNLRKFDPQVLERLADLSLDLEKCIVENTSQWRKSGLLIDSVDSKPCKPIIDEIDHVLAQHYGFTDEELDFIINYDIKYRMGEELFEDDEGDGGKNED